MLHGMSPPWPITPLSATAATITTRFRPCVLSPPCRPVTYPALSSACRRRCDGSRRSYGDRGLDPGVRVVVVERDVLEVEGVQLAHTGVEPQRRQLPRFAGELQPRLVEVVGVEV